MRWLWICSPLATFPDFDAASGLEDLPRGEKEKCGKQLTGSGLGS